MDRTTKSVVCDYGIYENGELKIICNSLRNARLIKAILDKDDRCNKSDYVFTSDDFDKFIKECGENETD